MPLSPALFLLAALARPAPAAPLSTRHSLDYTATTLGAGEVRLGPTDVDIGVLPGLHAGTDPLMDAVGLYNLRARVGGTLSPAVGLVGEVAGHSLELGELTAHHVRIEGRGSLWVGRLGLHLGTRVSRLAMSGSPDLTKASPLLQATLGQARLATAQEDLDASALNLRIHTTTVSLRTAAELRLSQAHALVIQGGDALHRQVSLDPLARATVDLLVDELPLTQLLQAEQGASRWASLAWQVTGSHLRLRLGAGISDVPGAWLAPTFELSWHLGEPG